jgi:hypothetical protein
MTIQVRGCPIDPFFTKTTRNGAQLLDHGPSMAMGLAAHGCIYFLYYCKF